MRQSRLLGWARRYLTYSNVIASLALFIALGGVSYAAIKIPANSVGTKQLKKGAVTGTKVKKGSLLARNFKAGQLPRGPRGERGPAGPPGEESLFAGRWTTRDRPRPVMAGRWPKRFPEPPLAFTS